MTPNERAPFVKAVCAGAAKAVASHSDWEAVRDYEEPMPESSARLWKRMRERYRRARKS